MSVIEGGKVIEGALVRTWRFAGTPVDGSSGTLAGKAESGDLLVDTTNKRLFMNVGTKSSPTWRLDTDWIEASPPSYSGVNTSKQVISADFTLAAGAGSNDGASPKRLAAMMGNVISANMTRTANTIAGLIGAYNVTGTNASTYPKAAVLGEIGDTTTTADGAFVAVIDGDSGVTTAKAAFKVKNNNSNASSGFDFGLDLEDAARDGYIAVNEAFYKKGLIRLPIDVVFLVKNGAPVDGVGGDGANNAGPGSILIDRSNKKLYINTNTKDSPTWTVVGTQV